MFKKLLLATLIVILGLWGAGYDVFGFKDDLVKTADQQAGKFSGQSSLNDDNWGPDA